VDARATLFYEILQVSLSMQGKNRMMIPLWLIDLLQAARLHDMFALSGGIASLRPYGVCSFSYAKIVDKCD